MIIINESLHSSFRTFCWHNYITERCACISRQQRIRWLLGPFTWFVSKLMKPTILFVLMQEIVDIHLQRDNNLCTSVSIFSDLFRPVSEVTCFRSISFEPTGAPRVELNCFTWVRWLRSWGARIRCHRRTRRRVASTRCSTVAVCPLVEHDG